MAIAKQSRNPHENSLFLQQLFAGVHAALHPIIYWVMYRRIASCCRDAKRGDLEAVVETSPQATANTGAMEEEATTPNHEDVEEEENECATSQSSSFSYDDRQDSLKGRSEQFARIPAEQVERIRQFRAAIKEAAPMPGCKNMSPGNSSLLQRSQAVDNIPFEFEIHQESQ